MTHTIQPRSVAVLNETGKDLNIQKPETEDNRNLLLAVIDSLNNLNEKINRLSYLVQKNQNT